MFDLTYSSEPVFFRRASRSSPLFPQLISQESYGICIWRKLIRAKNGCTETPQHRALLVLPEMTESGSSAAAVRLEARKMARRCLSQHTLILAVEARTEPVLGAPSNASDAGAWKPIPLRSKRCRLRFPPEKVGFWTYMRAFPFVESKLDSHWTKRSIADGASGVVGPTVILFAEEFTEMRSGQGWPLCSVRTSTTLI